MPRKKEVMFFDHPDKFGKGVEFYKSHWETHNTARAHGEVTPAYFWCSPEHPKWGAPNDFRQGIPQRVRAVIGPDVKLILQLRNPVDRAISAFLHHRKRGRYGADASIGKGLKEHGIMHMGFYGAHLDHWLKAFPRENFLIFTSEALFSGHVCLRNIKTFIGAGPVEGSVSSEKKIHGGVGFTRDLSGAVDGNGVRIATRRDISAMRQAYQDDVERLRDLSGLSFKEWAEDFNPSGASGNGLAGRILGLLPSALRA